MTMLLSDSLVARERLAAVQQTPVVPVRCNDELARVSQQRGVHTKKGRFSSEQQKYPFHLYVVQVVFRRPLGNVNARRRKGESSLL